MLPLTTVWGKISGMTVPETNESEPKTGPRPQTVYVVDDDASVRQAITWLMESVQLRTETSMIVYDETTDVYKKQAAIDMEAARTTLKARGMTDEAIAQLEGPEPAVLQDSEPAASKPLQSLL